MYDSPFQNLKKEGSITRQHCSGASHQRRTPPPARELDGEDQKLQHHCQLPGAEEKLVLQFMDSMHNYLSLFDEVSSALRQGWFDLASARHSMGASRINSSLLDLKFHPAATTLKITNCDGTQPHFMLRKWVSSEHESTQLEDEHVQPQDDSVKSSGLADNDEVQKERSKSLSVFGVLISPKLRASQLSFERALETLIEIANMRSSLLYSFHQLQKAEDTKQ
ncbi:coiled-coil domain-containing protein 115 isoform X2 [Cajanus cajan]|uniref:coiled-coil domain-containing protein 115 isoform X2 n=1 Tax=Cajanus cajan TaxID=3821 RepID=UPI00098D8EC9|nr:coiled-coil domain-containing protein 115 isoform X2 [Cajanus cajan]